MLEALHRASADATIVVLSDEPIALPTFVTRVGRSDAQALRTLLVPEQPAAAQPAAAPQQATGTDERTAGGSR